MRLNRSTPLAALLLALLLAACAGNRQQGGYAATQHATVTVDNQAWVEFNIFVIRSNARIRLGSVPGQSRRTFNLPSNIVGTGTVVRFMADPVGGNSQPQSYELTIRGDQQLRLTIPYRNY